MSEADQGRRAPAHSWLTLTEAAARPGHSRAALHQRVRRGRLRAQKDKVEAACQRGDLMEKRRRLMTEWATFCSRPAPAGELVPLRARA